MHLDDFRPLKNTLRELAQGVIRKNAQKIDETGTWPQESIQQIQAAGLAGLLIPKKFGGHGLGYLAMAQACEIMGAECASTSMCYGMHLVGSAVMRAKANKNHEEEFLMPIAQGKHWTTLALSEPGTGSHFYIPEMQMTHEQDQLILNGQKSFVTNGSHADSYVMSAVSDKNAKSMGQFSCLIVPENTSGLKWGDPWHGLGMRGNSSRTVELNNVRVPEQNLLGSLGDQIWYVFEVIAPNFLVAMSGTYLGIATAALNEAVEHLKNRRYSHSGDELSTKAVLQHRVGVLWGEVERTRQLIYSAAALGDQGDPNALVSIMSAKAEVADCVVNVVNETMTLMGGKAYAGSASMARHLRDARASHVMSPTTDILRTWTGRALLNVPLLGD